MIVVCRSESSDLFTVGDGIDESFLLVGLAILEDTILGNIFQGFVSLDAGAANQNEEDAAEGERAHHDITSNVGVIAHEEHRGDEQVEEAFAHDCPQELEVLHDKVQITE